jgi:hypothetical protein
MQRVEVIIDTLVRQLYKKPAALVAVSLFSEGEKLKSAAMFHISVFPAN